MVNGQEDLDAEYGQPAVSIPGQVLEDSEMPDVLNGCVTGVNVNADRQHALLKYAEVNAVLSCPGCGGCKGQWRGYRQRRDGRVAHRRLCTQCGRWYFTIM